MDVSASALEDIDVEKISDISELEVTLRFYDDDYDTMAEPKIAMQF